ncbi:hypothetical protein DFH07DRAFT_843177 [Mycena maculata]|uniref:Zn(2)-C6 fungal-type domain-containing protein n=1 Tax=Mycena maculata TaxID=230809 RepID=A0AAD7I859_9AGAR|nr:hypothetical protein DFH07DRAFT_843177 [Mycena maculata]
METKYKTPTCFRCKMRKTRCDGLSPCTGCSSTGCACTYDGEAKERRVELELRKGAACLTCRRRKKKCDGRLPCRTCLSSRNKINCEYQDGVVMSVENSSENETRSASHSTDSVSPDSARTPFDVSHTFHSTNSSETSVSSSGSPIYITIPADLNPPQNIDIGDIQSPSPFTIVDLPSQSNYVTFADLVHARDDFLELTERALEAAEPPPESEDVVLVPATDDSLDFTIDPQSPFFHIPAPSPDSDELARIRKLFLSHRIQLGLSVTDARLEALAAGETGGVVHPVLMHACQLMGYMLARHLQHNTWLRLPGQSDGEAEQTRLGMESLQQFALTPCPMQFLQTCTLFSLYFFNKGDIRRSREILIKANKMALDHKYDERVRELLGADEGKSMAFVVAPTMGEGEVLAALVQVVYLDLTYGIILKLPSVVDSRLYACFKVLVTAPNAHAEINFVRAKSAFLLSEAQRLAMEWHAPDFAERDAAKWKETYWALMEALDAHRSFITVTLTKLAFCPELHALTLSLKLCAIVVLTGIAELLALFTGAQPELRRKKYDAVSEIISITGTFTEEDCEFLDPILSACWTTIIGTLDHCISLGPVAIKHSMHDLPAMANMVRERNRTLQRVLPFALDI